MAVERWLTSKLHDSLGFSNPTLVDMLLHYTRTSASTQELEKKLRDKGLDNTITPLARELYDYINTSITEYESTESLSEFTSGLNIDSNRAPEAFLDEVNPEISSTTLTHTENITSALSNDDLRQLDIKARDALNLRIRERDDRKRKTMNSETQQDKPNSHEQIDITSPIELTLAAKKPRNERLKDVDLYMDKLRDQSRRDYLRKREVEHLELTGKFIEDKAWLLKDADLSASEIKTFEIEKQTYEIAKSAIQERTRKSDLDHYVMPDDYDQDTQARVAVMTQKFEDPKSAMPTSDQMIWEKTQTSSAIAHFGSKKQKIKGLHEKESKQNTYLLDEHGSKIDFIAHEIHGGSDESKNLVGYDKMVQLKNSAKLKKLSLQQERMQLPVYLYRESLLKAIHQYPVLVVVGETGSGKTTQIPQYLYEVGYHKVGKIGCTQPRRVAAMSVASRVAEEMGVKLGREVGYSIRFEDCTSEKTVVKYMTDGMLLREFLSEPDLSSYSVVLIDEAHERTLHTDILFGLVKDLSRYKDDFKLIISSATLEAEKFSAYFDNAPIFKIPGRRFPVQIYYTKSPEANFIEASVVTILQIHLTQPLGDILVFFPGQQEIEESQEELERRIRGKGTEFGELIVLPIYSSLPSELQSKIFEPTPEGARKVVLATNIAETSITIANIVYVIDPGFCKQNTFNPKTGMESLVIVPCSKASANQRAGRAGRVKPGHCFRLYTKFSFNKEMDDANVPEIQRTNLGNVVLSLKSIGIDDLINFDFMDPPPPETLIKALELLYALGALNDKGQLTKLGRRMAEFPMDPMYSKMILQADKYKCVEECIAICSMLGVGNSIFYRPKDKALHADNARKNFFRNGGDHLTLLNVYTQWESMGYSINWCYENFVQYRSMKRAKDIYDQIVALLDRVEVELSSNPNDGENIRKSVTSGFFTQGARMNKNGSYITIKNPHTVDIHPQSSLFGQQAKIVIYTELVLTTKEYMRNVSEIKPQWLIEAAPHYYKHQEIELGGKMPKGLGLKQSKY